MRVSSVILAAFAAGPLSVLGSGTLGFALGARRSGKGCPHVQR